MIVGPSIGGYLVCEIALQSLKRDGRRLTDHVARFNILSSIIVGVTALICLLAPGVNAPTAGFALAFANSIQHDLLFVVRRFVQLEQSMVALERIKE